MVQRNHTMSTKSLNKAPAKVVIKAAHINKALKAANVAGVDFADDKNLPTTFVKARKAEEVVARKTDGLFAGLAAAHLVRIGAGTYSAKEFTSALLYNKTATQLREMKGGDAVYTRLMRYRRSIFALIGETGHLVNENEALRVVNATGAVAEAKPKKERAPRAPGAGKQLTKGKGKAAGQPNAPEPSKADGSACTVITLGNIKKKMKAEEMAAFIASVATQFMVTLESEDSDARTSAMQNIEGKLTRLLADVCNED